MKCAMFLDLGWRPPVHASSPAGDRWDEAGPVCCHRPIHCPQARSDGEDPGRTGHVRTICGGWSALLGHSGWYPSLQNCIAHRKELAVKSTDAVYI